MDISPIKKSTLFLGSQEIPSLTGTGKKKAGKSLLQGKKKDFSNKPRRLKKKNSLMIVPIESINDNKDSKKQKNIEKLFEKEVADISENASNMFASENLYDFSPEVFLQAKKSFQEKDALLKQNIEFANEDVGEFVKDFPAIEQDITYLIDDKRKKTFIVSSSINSYINETKSPIKDLQVSKKTCELLFSKEKVNSWFKNQGFFYN